MERIKLFFDKHDGIRRNYERCQTGQNYTILIPNLASHCPVDITFILL